MFFGLGCALGCVSHTVLAALGVSALIAASPVTFLALKVCGGLYLIWMGVQALRSRGGVSVASTRVVDESLQRLFGKGLVANAINPKVVLFFLSFAAVRYRRSPDMWDCRRRNWVLRLAQAAVLFGLLGYFPDV